jgi:hypothetical protein
MESQLVLPILSTNCGSLFGKLSPFEIFVSIVALATGAYTIYKNFCERAKLKIYTGDAIRLVFSNKSVAATRFHLMCNFVNKSTKVGIIHRLEAKVKGPQKNSLNFVWNLFYKYEHGGLSVAKDVDPHPIAVAQKDSKLVFIEFELEAPNQQCPWQEGRYNFEIVGWVNKKHKNQRTNLKTEFHVNISEDVAKQLKSWVISGGSKESPVYFSLPIEEWSNQDENISK